MHKEGEKGLQFFGGPVAHARVRLEEREAGPVTVYYKNSSGDEIESFATQYDGYWSHPVYPDRDYKFCARWEDSTAECPSKVVFTKDEIKSSMPPEVFKEPQFD